MTTETFKGAGDARFSFRPQPGQNRRVSEATGAATTTNGKTQGVRLKTVALPVEHGGWGLALEPVVLGLCVAASWPGACLALATLAAFLTRHPLKIVAGDRRRGRRFPRTRAAERFALLYGAIAFITFTLAAAFAPAVFLWPLALAAPLAFVQLAYDALGRSRALLPELAGATAMASVAAALALAGGWTLAPALALWAVLTLRVVPAILYVRARLSISHGARPALWPALLAHAAAFTAVAALVWLRLAPALALLAMLVLLARAALSLLRPRPQTKAKHIGFGEIGFGLMTVLALVCGYAFGL
jgi:4-hydroxybenzoate polyprenyltransferase